MTLINMLAMGEQFEGIYLVRELLIKQTSTHPPREYLDMIVGDSSGSLPAKYWDATFKEKQTIQKNEIVSIKGVVHNYSNKLQLKITSIKKADPKYYDITKFIQTAPISSTELINIIKENVRTLQESDLKIIVSYCFNKVETRLLDSPAAKNNHHNYYGGLAYHLVRMLEISKFICEQRPFLDSELLRAGIILHDLGKTEEMLSTMGIVSDYTDRGKLIGHISIISNWIIEAAIKNNIDPNSSTVMYLQHMVLSHHNLGEWGSPVQPQIAEAVALHYIDMLDAKLQMVEDSFKNLNSTDSWTPPIWGLEKKAMLRTKF
ncbi:3'-5' exoribonuclease YhaM family protein [Paenibacillus taichungensis]